MSAGSCKLGAIIGKPIILDWPMAQKRRGRPPGSKKKREPVIAARIPDGLLKSLKGLAKKRGRVPSAQTLSAEVGRALQFWVNHHAIPHVHNSLLGTLVAVMADRIEGITGARWTDDAATREVVREYVERLISHILQPLSERVTISAEVREGADLILLLLKGAMPRPGSPRLVGRIIIDDRGLADIMEDAARHLGEGSVNVGAPDLLVARREQDEEAWANAVRIGTADAFTDYVQKFRSGRHVIKARERLAALEKQKGRK